MDAGALGRVYQDQETIYCQGEAGDFMFVILEGKVELYVDRDGQEVSIKLCRDGEFVGEMALFQREKRSSNARAIGKARLLTVDKKNFLRRVQEDPTIALRLVQNLSQRIHDLDEEIVVLNHVINECLDAQLRQKGPA
jgi:CRP-like cAMP-binding protein